MRDIPTGPALNSEEAEALLGLMSDPRWPVYAGLIGRMKTAAIANLRRRGKGEEENGYWKGVWAATEDIEELPEKLTEQLKPAEQLTDKEDSYGE